MKTCPKCGASNSDYIRRCNECDQPFDSGHAESTRSSARIVEPPTRRTAKPIDSVKTRATRYGNRVDLCFMLDCSGGMQGPIDALRDSTLDLIDSLAQCGILFRLGLIEIREEGACASDFNGAPMTGDPYLFRREVAKLEARGERISPHGLADAVSLAMRQPSEGKNYKVLVAIVDALRPDADREHGKIRLPRDLTRGGEIDRLHLIFPEKDEGSDLSRHLLAGSVGEAHDLGPAGNYRRRADNVRDAMIRLGGTIVESLKTEALR